MSHEQHVTDKPHPKIEDLETPVRELTPEEAEAAGGAYINELGVTNDVSHPSAPRVDGFAMVAL